MEPNSCGTFNDLSADLEEAILKCIELGPCPLCAAQATLSEGVQEHVCGTVQEEPELVGLKAVAGRTI